MDECKSLLAGKSGPGVDFDALLKALMKEYEGGGAPVPPLERPRRVEAGGDKPGTRGGVPGSAGSAAGGAAGGSAAAGAAKKSAAMAGWGAALGGGRGSAAPSERGVSVEHGVG